MYADRMTDSMTNAIEETSRRRAIQDEYNQSHGITPQTIQKKVRELISISKKVAKEMYDMKNKELESMSKKELEEVAKKLTKEMHKAAAELNFELAAELRDKLVDLKKQLNDMD
jgi:excinuclease ABC subunit B